MKNQKTSQILPISIGLLNLSGLGLGYLYMKRWIRWGVHFLITLGLIGLASLTNASTLSSLWIPVFILWLLWMAFDGWRQGRNFTPEEGLVPGKFFNERKWVMIAVPIILLCFVGTGFAAYSVMGQKTFQRGMEAYQDADCQTAARRFRRVSTIYELTFAPYIAKADERLAECKKLLSADVTREEGEYEEAIESYQGYLDEYAGGDLAQFAVEGLADSYFDWGVALQEEGSYQEAIRKYEQVLQEYPETPASDRVPPHLVESYLALSDQLWEAGEYQAAIEKARVPLSDYSDTPSGKEAAEQIAQIYCDWARDLQSRDLYQAAAGKIRFVLERHPETEAVENIKPLAAEIYFDWASSLAESGSYMEAVEKYEIVLDEYAEEMSGETVKANIKSTYLTWADSLRKKEAYEGAIEKYQTLREEYPQTIAAEEVNTLVQETKLAWGSDLTQKGEFIEALDTFAYLKDAAVTTEISQTAEERYQQALWGLSQDKGEEGKQVMAETLNEVCDGDPVSSPVVGLAEDEAGKALACDSMYTLPSDLQADYPGHLQYVVSRTEGAKTVQTCAYEQDHTLYRKQVTWTITVRKTVSGDFFSKTFYGSMPPSCQYTETFYGKTKSKFGSDPSTEDVNDWLERVIE
ncbi:MAG: outer membrane protein assembly factor BamD [Anaerolineales bacterium]